MSADFTWAPDFPLEKTYGYSTLISQFENGVEQRRPTRSSSVSGWKLKGSNRPQSEHDIVTAFYEAQKGAFGAFTWLNPEDGVIYNVRFKDDTLMTSYKMFGLWDIEFNLILVI